MSHDVGRPPREGTDIRGGAAQAGRAHGEARLTAARRILDEALAAGAFPAAVAEVGRTSGVIWSYAGGRLSRDPDAPPATIDTIFDLASLTKVIATTTVVMQLVGEGRLGLEDRVGRWLSEWRGHDRDHVTVEDLLAHCSGLSAHLPLYRECEGRREFQPAICSLPLEYEPRCRAVYSDLGFILLGFIAADAAGEPLDRRVEALGATIGAGELAFRPPPAWRGRTAPTGVDRWRGRLLVGEVHDRNAWALGGVAGHAGLFGTAAAVGAFARAMLRTLRWPEAGDAPVLGDPSLARRFATRTAIPGSSRALGWDTMLPTSSCGTKLHPRAIGHTGYTGTSLWIDPVADFYVVLLTNRVHPTDENQSILAVRPRFHDAVADALGALAEGA
jgi:CubicO group peptidase (beta-lactamase class C family)